MLDVLKIRATYDRMILAAIPLMTVCTTAASALLASVISFVTVLAAGVCISALKPWLSHKTAPLAQIIIAVGLVGARSMVISVFAKDIIKEIAVYLPLIAVTTALLINCDYALNNRITSTLLYGCVIGGANSLFLLTGGIVREILGKGSLFGFNIYTDLFSPAEFFATPAGGLLTAALLTVIYNLLVKAASSRKEKAV